MGQLCSGVISIGMVKCVASELPKEHSVLYKLLDLKVLLFWFINYRTRCGEVTVRKLQYSHDLQTLTLL